MKLPSRLGLVLALMLFFVAIALADLSCNVGTSCGSTTILRLENDTGGYLNAHAQIPGYGSYANYICCSSSTQTVGTSCTASKTSKILRLSNETNAHVQDAYNSSLPIIYNNLTCLSGTGTNYCTLSENTCPSGFECLGSIAGTEGNNYTNAHISDCSDYNLQVCCFLNSLPTHSTPSLTSSSGNNLTSDNLSVAIVGANDADSHTIKYNYDWRRSGTSIAVLNMPFNTNISNISGAFVKDYSSYGNNGSLGNSSSNTWPVWNSTGKVGGAYTFDGIDDYIKIASSFYQYDKELTVSWWINYQTMQPGSGMGQSNETQDNMASNVWLMHASGNIMIWYVNDAGTWRSVSTGALSSGAWHHIVGTINESSINIYVDGTEVQSGAGISTGIVNNQNSAIHIGKDVRYASGRWYNGSIDEVKIFNKSLSPEQIKALYDAGNGGNGINKLVSNETNSGESWSVSVTPSDGYDDGITRSSNSLTIQNCVPDIPTLIYPVDETIIDRYLNFNWTSSSDCDGDPVHYEINVTAPTGLNCFGFNDDNVLESNITSTTELCTDLDHSSESYEWEIRACDPTQCSSWSSVGYFNVTSVNSISLEQNSVNFSTLNRDTSEDTTDNVPPPLIVRNDGNIRVNISARASAALFQTVPDLNDSSFQFMAGTNESNSFNSSKSTMSWINVTNITRHLIGTLLYSNSSDNAEIELRVIVPLFEPPGTKQVSIVLESNPDSPS